MHRHRADALRGQLVVLILHEGDEWAHDDGETGQQDRGKLIDERLPAARGHYHQSIFSGENSSKRLPLARPEIAMAKALREQLTGCLFRYSFGHSVGYRHKLFRLPSLPSISGVGTRARYRLLPVARCALPA